MGMDDPELMARWRRGDVAAFEALVLRWQQPMARFLYRMTGRADLVADGCQDVFLRLYRTGPRYREQGKFAGWIYRIALHVARDQMRRKRRSTESLRHDVVDPSVSGIALCHTAEVRQKLADAVARLPEPLRLALVLRHDEGMGFEAIGRLTGAPASTIKSRFAAALARLRQQLEQLGYDTSD